MISEFSDTGENNYLRQFQSGFRRKCWLSETTVKSKDNLQPEKQIMPNTNSMILEMTLYDRNISHEQFNVNLIRNNW